MRGNIKREGVGVGRVRGEDLETGGRVVVGVLHLYLLTQMVHTQPATGHNIGHNIPAKYGVHFFTFPEQNTVEPCLAFLPRYQVVETRV